MSLNIKNAEAHRLAQAISEATGESLTQVVTGALRERYAKLERDKSKPDIAEMLAIADRIRAHIKQPMIDHDALLYDEHGLPK